MGRQSVAERRPRGSGRMSTGGGGGGGGGGAGGRVTVHHSSARCRATDVSRP